MVAVSLISKRYRFTLISKDTYDALTEDEREQVVGDLWKEAKERLDRRIEEEEERHDNTLNTYLKNGYLPLNLPGTPKQLITTD